MREEELVELQKQIGAQASTVSRSPPDTIRYIAGFDVTFAGRQMICGTAVLDYKTLTVVERKHAVLHAHMPYVPGFRAFREGPGIVQAYYDIEHEPDVLMISGHGIAHQHRCGLATYVGVELDKPAVGVSKSLLHGHVQDTDIVVNGAVCGRIMLTKDHAKPILVSPGHMMSIPDAIAIVQRCIIPPHKLPEPLHAAHKHAKSILAQFVAGGTVQEAEEDEVPEEYRMNSGLIV